MRLVNLSGLRLRRPRARSTYRRLPFSSDNWPGHNPCGSGRPSHRVGSLLPPVALRAGLRRACWWGLGDPRYPNQRLWPLSHHLLALWAQERLYRPLRAILSHPLLGVLLALRASLHPFLGLLWAFRLQQRLVRGLRPLPVALRQSLGHRPTRPHPGLQMFPLPLARLLRDHPFSEP